MKPQESKQTETVDRAQAVRLARLIEIQRELDLRKALYAEYDQIVLELAHSGFERTVIDGLVLELCDNFKDSNTGWTSAAVKRYEVEILDKEKYEKRQARRAKKAGGEE